MDLEKIKKGIDTTLKIESEIRKTVEYNSEIEEVEKLMKKLHEEHFETVNLWAYKKSKSMGKTAEELKKSNISFAEFFKLQGLRNGEYTQLSMEFAELSFDIAAKHGLSIENATEVLKSAIQREENALKFLNVNLDTNRLNKLSNDKAILNTSGIILSETSGIRGATEIEKPSYKDKKNKTVESYKEITGRTLGKAFSGLYEDFFDLVNPVLEQEVLNLQKISDFELNNIIKNQEMNLKDRIENYKNFMDQSETNPEYKELANKEYEELSKILPKFMEQIPNTKKGAQVLFDNQEVLLEELREKIKIMALDKNFQVDNEKIKLKYDTEINKIIKESERSRGNFNNRYHADPNVVLENDRLKALVAEYNKERNGQFSYRNQPEINKLKDEILKEVQDSKIIDSKILKSLPYNGKDDFINSLADHEQMVRRNEKRIPEIEKEAEKDFRELLNNYNTANDPVASYHKYLSNEYFPDMLKTTQEYNKKIEKENSKIKKEKENFNKAFGANYDEILKNPEVEKLLNNLSKKYNEADYAKLGNILAGSGQITKKGYFNENATLGLMTSYKKITKSELNVEKYQVDFKKAQTAINDGFQKVTKDILSPSAIKKTKPTEYKMISSIKEVAGVLIKIPEIVPKTSTSGGNTSQNQGGKQTVQRQIRRQPQRTVTYKEPTKWEVMSKELKKAVKDLESKAGKMGKVILDTSDKLAKLELEKLHKFSDVMGMSESDVLFSEIGILEKQRQIALEVGKKEKVESLTAEIKEKKKKAENAKFYDDINGSYEQKTNQLNFKPSDKQYDDFKEKFAGYYDAKMENLTRLLVNGLITKNQFEQESLNLMGEKIQKLIDLKKYNEAMKLTLEKYQAEYIKIQEDAQKDIEDIKKKGEVFNSRESETIKQQINIREKERLDLYSTNKKGTDVVDDSLKATNEQLAVAIKNKDYNEADKLNKRIEELKEEKNKLNSDEKIKEINEKISKLKVELDTTLISEALSDGIRDIFKNINPKDFRGSLASNLDSLFEKQFNVLLDKDNPYNGYKSIIEEKMKEAFDGYKLTGDYVLDQSEFNKRFEKYLDSLIATGEQGLVNLAGSMKMERVKTSLDDLASTLSRAGSVLKDDFLTNLSVTAESLSGLTSIFQNTNLAGPIGEKIGGLGNFLSPFTSVVGTVFGTVNAGVSLFRSFGIGSSKNKKHNEEEKRKANEWYENKSKENENLFSEINTLTNSIQNLTTKLIQNIASDTSDKNISKQKSYYDMLIGKTGNLYEGQITATGHSSKKKGLFGGKKNSHATLSQGFDEYFGSIWKNTARDSGSLQSFYDTYLQNFDLSTLKRKLGKSKLDNNNIEEVKLSFLRFIEDVRVMEQYSANLPKNGILESFEGVEVADLFELRNEYQKQLEDIYKGMGKDPEKYRDEILSTVNSLIQNDQVIVSAFQDVKSRTIEQLSSGNNVILGLATGMESYFSKLESNFSKVFYDMQFQGFEEKFSNKFENLTNNLADFRLSGRKDFDNFLNENLNFWDLFTDLKNTEYIENDMKHIIDTLKNQAKASGLSDEVINAMFPDEKINEKTEKIKNALENSIRKALETNSFEQFSMSLGDSIYNNVKESLVKAFYESQSFQTLADKYFLTEDYKNALDGAGSFKDAYSIIQQKLSEVELKLQSEGMDFRGTNAADGNYYGMSGKQEYKTSGILDNSKGVEFAVTLNNYGFMSNSEFMNTLKKEMKEFLYESGKEEV